MIQSPDKLNCIEHHGFLWNYFQLLLRDISSCGLSICSKSN